MFKACPKSTEGMKSLDVKYFTNVNSLQGWGWRAKSDPSFEAEVREPNLYHDKSCIAKKLDTDVFWTIDSVHKFQSNGNMSTMSRALWPMKAPPRTDFTRSIEEFNVLTAKTTPCDVMMWAGEADSVQKDRFGDVIGMEYDLPDTSYISLSFIKDDPKQQGESWLLSVDHSFRDTWVMNYGERIPLNQD